MTAPTKAIDGARDGISKSTLTTPCERKAYYGDAIRLPDGQRLRFPMPSRVHFGRAVDRVHADIVYAASIGNWPTVTDVQEWTAAAVEEARKAYADEGWTDTVDLDVFGRDVAEAVAIFQTHADGWPRLKPHLSGIRVQGDNGRSLRAGDVVGTPDYILEDGILDVKTTERRYYPDRFTDSAEMPIYAYLFREEYGRAPDRLVYQVYVRNQRPYWQWLEAPGGDAIADLGARLADSWRKRVMIDDPDVFATDRRFCDECPFAQPIPEVGFDGCAVGMLTLAATPQEEAA